MPSSEGRDNIVPFLLGALANSGALQAQEGALELHGEPDFGALHHASGATATPASGIGHSATSTGSSTRTGCRACSISPPTTSRSRNPSGRSDYQPSARLMRRGSAAPSICPVSRSLRTAQTPPVQCDQSSRRSMRCPRAASRPLVASSMRPSRVTRPGWAAWGREGIRVAVGDEAGGLHRVLQVHAEGQVIQERLQVGLDLRVAPGGSEGHDPAARRQCEAGVRRKGGAACPARGMRGDRAPPAIGRRARTPRARFPAPPGYPSSCLRASSRARCPHHR